MRQSLPFIEDPVEFSPQPLVLSVIGLSCDVATKVFQVIERHHHRLASWNFLNELLVLWVKAHQVFEDRLYFCRREL
jgi:hypothetical protein